MIPFATEFPVKSILNRTVFIAQVTKWLSGVKNSTIIEAGKTELDSENAVLRSPKGEELRLRELYQEDGSKIIGIRHDIPDEEGRTWRTEAVLRHDNTKANKEGILRIRTQCFALKPGVHLDFPRKPYLVKNLLGDGLGGYDGLLDVSDQPIWLDDDDEGMMLAYSATLGQASRYLPIIYVSAMGTEKWSLSKNDIQNLAFKLGGVAHVVLEPSRSFSFLLREKAEGANVYGGSIGLTLPEKGLVRRFHLGWQFRDKASLINELHNTTLNLRSQMPAESWDWIELQEQALHIQRNRDKNQQHTTKQKEESLREEILTLKEQINQLKEQISSRPVTETIGQESWGLSNETLIGQIGPEIYHGEFSDRLRLAVIMALDVADQKGLDRRSKAIFQEIKKKLPVSPSLSNLIQDLEQIAKNPKKIASDATKLLSRHGYQGKSENKHIRLEAKKGYTGLEAITLPKTPSDNRGLKNQVSQIKQALGVNKLSG